MQYAQALQALKNHPAVASKDIEACLKGTGKFAYTEKVHAAMVTYGIDPEVVFALPQKAVKRAIQMVGAVYHQQYAAVDATTACGTYALHLAPGHELCYDSLHFLIGGIARVEGATGDTKGVSRAKLARLFARVGVNTVSTQKSRTWGDNGFAQALGMTWAPTRTQGRVVTLNPEHPLVRAFVALIDKGTDAQIDQIGAKGE